MIECKQDRQLICYVPTQFSRFCMLDKHLSPSEFKISPSNSMAKIV